MSFQIGDVCVTVDAHSEVMFNTRLLGLQVTVTGPLGSRVVNGEPMHEIQYQDGGKGHAAPRCLRRIPPKPTYDDQFAPCEKDWLQDFQRTMKVGETS